MTGEHESWAEMRSGCADRQPVRRDRAFWCRIYMDCRKVDRSAIDTVEYDRVARKLAE